MMSNGVSNTSITGRTWVAFGPNGAVGSIHEAEGGYTYKLLDEQDYRCLLYTSPSPRDRQKSRMPSSA